MIRNLRERFLSTEHTETPTPDRFAYARPRFLQLNTTDELRASADHNVRPIIVPRDISIMPWGTGYAECVNAGKSKWNEDQAEFSRFVLSDPPKYPDLPYTYFGIFDGHAGFGAALGASQQLHHILFNKLVDCMDTLLCQDFVETAPTESPQIDEKSFLNPRHFEREVSKDELIVGALESSFCLMDSWMTPERVYYPNAGGCTACVALFINGKLFVANAGDSRAVLCLRRRPAEKKTPENGIISEQTADEDLGSYAQAMSFDHTPETEKPRLLQIAKLRPDLLDRKYAAMEYTKRPRRKDLGKRVLCRRDTMEGWTYKMVTPDDMRMPVVSGEGKRSRLLGTLGVTRGFGDHELRDIHAGLHIKPFLTPQPEVQCRDLTKIVSIPDEHNEDGDYGILVMATDGLWDVTDNETVARTVFKTLAKYPTEKHRYTMAAQELVARARGKINECGHWRLGDSKAAATVDDISVIVIPVYQYYKEHVAWMQKCKEKCQKSKEPAEPAAASEADEAKETITVKLVNSVTKATVSLNDADDDDDDEEIVVEVNRGGEKVHAIVEVEELPVTSVEKREALDKVEETLNKATEDLAHAALVDGDESLNVSSQSAATPDKLNKSNQNQKQRHQRNRKDKR